MGCRLQHAHASRAWQADTVARRTGAPIALQRLVVPIFLACSWPTLASAAAGSAEPPADSERVLTPARTLVIDGVVMLAAGSGWALLAAYQGQLVPGSCPCDASDLNPVDRLAVREHWPYGELVADAVLGVSFGASLAVLTHMAGNRREFLEDALLVTESAMLAGFFTQIAKTSVGRPYPYMYRRTSADELDNGLDYASFWSGHAAVPMSVVGSLGYVLGERRPDSSLRWGVWTVGPLLAIAAGTLQMTAGNHFPSDIVAGAAVGLATGYLNALLHDVW